MYMLSICCNLAPFFEQGGFLMSNPHPVYVIDMCSMLAIKNLFVCFELMNDLNSFCVIHL